MRKVHTGTLERAVKMKNLRVVRSLNLHLKLTHVSATLALAEVRLFFGLEIGLLTLSTLAIRAR